MENAKSLDIQGAKSKSSVEDVPSMTSSVRLIPTIDKIVITDSFLLNLYTIEIKAFSDAITTKIASGIQGLLTDRGYKPALDIQLKTAPSNLNPPL